MGGACCKAQPLIKKESQQSIVDQPIVVPPVEKDKAVSVTTINHSTSAFGQTTKSIPRLNKSGLSSTQWGDSSSPDTKMSQRLSDLESCLQKSDLKRTYHSNFSKAINTQTDSDSDATEIDQIDYHRVDVVGEGQLSVVYKAVNLRNGKNLAIKFFKIPVDQVSSYIHGMKACVNLLKSKLDNSSKMFIEYFDCSKDEDTEELILVMEPVSDMTLYEYIE